MVHLSKKQVKKETQSAIRAQLIASVAQARTKKDAATLIDELLSDDESLMLAKRFATVAMLARGYSLNQIADLLKVSPSTVSVISNDIQQGRYDTLFRYTQRQKSSVKEDSVVSFLELIMSVGGVMPPRGRGRWKNLDKWDPI